MKKILMIFILSFGWAAMADRLDTFHGTIECTGPYHQLSDPDFPPGSIRLRYTPPLIPGMPDPHPSNAGYQVIAQLLWAISGYDHLGSSHGHDDR